MDGPRDGAQPAALQPCSQRKRGADVPEVAMKKRRSGNNSELSRPSVAEARLSMPSSSRSTHHLSNAETKITKAISRPKTGIAKKCEEKDPMTAAIDSALASDSDE